MLLCRTLDGSALTLFPFPCSLLPASGSPSLPVQVTWFEGNYQDYEEDRQRRGLNPVAPQRVKFRKLANV